MIKVWVKGFRKDCITDVSGYFNIFKQKNWFNNENVKRYIKAIDNTVAVKDEYLESPIFGGMSPERLSSGCKALILLEVLDDVNVYATRCGDNCAPYLLEIGERKDITVTFHHCMHLPKDATFNMLFLDSGNIVHDSWSFTKEFYSIWSDKDYRNLELEKGSLDDLLEFIDSLFK